MMIDCVALMSYSHVAKWDDDGSASDADRDRAQAEMTREYPDIIRG